MLFLFIMQKAKAKLQMMYSLAYLLQYSKKISFKYHPLETGLQVFGTVEQNPIKLIMDLALSK